MAPWLMAYGLRLMAYGLWLMAYGSWLMAYGYGSWLMAYGLRLMAYGSWLDRSLLYPRHAERSTKADGLQGGPPTGPRRLPDHQVAPRFRALWPSVADAARSRVDSEQSGGRLCQAWAPGIPSLRRPCHGIGRGASLPARPCDRPRAADTARDRGRQKSQQPCRQGIAESAARGSSVRIQAAHARGVSHTCQPSPVSHQPFSQAAGRKPQAVRPLPYASSRRP